VSAQTKTWIGGTGATWDTESAWNTPGEPTAADDAFFPAPVPAPGATITLTAGELANSLAFDAAYTLSGGNLSLTPPTNPPTSVGAGNVTVVGGVTATINSALVGTGSPLTKLGAGTLVLGGTNTFTGPININAGVLAFGNNVTGETAAQAATRLGNASTPITLNGGTLRYNGTVRFPSDADAANQHNFTIGAGGGTFDTPAGQFEIRSAANSLTAPAGATLTKTGTGTLRVASPNAGFDAGAFVVLNAGVLEAANATAFGTAG
jgi:fibronectin-binding autotransporter adhesin